jgi:hypothetical protein
MLENLQYLSIILEAVISILGLLIVFKKKKQIGLFIFITFFIYVVYDFSKLIKLNFSGDALYLMFFAATLSALYFSWIIYKKK